jgi:hypothetical protein
MDHVLASKSWTMEEKNEARELVKEYINPARVRYQDKMNEKWQANSSSTSVVSSNIARPVSIGISKV